MNLKDSKKAYDSIEIPEELEFTVRKAIASVDKKKALEERKKNIMKKRVKGLGTVAACVIICSTAALNTSETFASEMAKIPVIGSIAKVLTIRSYHTNDDMFNVNIDVPEIETNGNLSPEINKEIEKIVDDFKSQSETEFKEYKEAFFATGGTEEEWADRKMDINISYDVKALTDKYLSLELTAAKGWVSSETEVHFYNINLEDDKEISLKDFLGDDYVNICNESIKKQIEERIAEDENNIYFGFNDSDDGMAIDGFNSVDSNTKFYINDKGNAVVVFDKYEIAPGYMGIQEFEITK